MCKSEKINKSTITLEEQLDISPIDANVREDKLRWYEHVESYPTNFVIRHVKVIRSKHVMDKGEKKNLLQYN